MSDIFTASARGVKYGKMSIAHGLIILIELAGAFYGKDVNLYAISVKHDLPLSQLEPIAVRLEEAGLLVRHPDDFNKLILNHVPEGRWIYDVIPVLKNALNSEPNLLITM